MGFSAPMQLLALVRVVHDPVVDEGSPILALLAADVGAAGLGVCLRCLGLGVDGLASGTPHYLLVSLVFLDDEKTLWCVRVLRELLQLEQEERVRLLECYRDFVRQRREISQVESDESRILGQLM